MDKPKRKPSLDQRLAQREMDELGGEPLEGSGFELEEPEPLSEQAVRPA
jgi:hypothetical protein